MKMDLISDSKYLERKILSKSLFSVLWIILLTFEHFDLHCIKDVLKHLAVPSLYRRKSAC